MNQLQVKRSSIDASAEDGTHDAEHKLRLVEELPRLHLDHKATQLRTNLEMWVMDAICALFGVEDSDELPEELQEDAQCATLEQVLSEGDPERQRMILEQWLVHAPDAKVDFIAQVLHSVAEILEAHALLSARIAS
eukprot:gnl/TRDRNA2_/TRDRNA2_190714_c0_seq1.p1 gnl/TRDRNA2_/TRDRNA2_190714_c0~~gnl/TRDRNA2_/TRDRNA2_190714_c0_seq1.p1  ORF type:complete len:136 (+),score=25.64 gnl/TRDRNA2_/TRDRNA2_190714_c0_seq1:160-567(+)